MILYTIMPLEVVFSETATPAGQNQCFEIIYQGERVEVMVLPDHRQVVKRVLSSSPQAFLNPHLMPGTMLKDMKD